MASIQCTPVSTPQNLCLCGCETLVNRRYVAGHQSKVKPPRKTHGWAADRKRLPPEYQAWVSMRRRCREPRPDYVRNYQARGISVCDRWQNSFEAFLEDMGPRPSGSHTLDRINNNGNYEPGNCRWATMKEQSRNTRNKRNLTLNGVTMSITEWGEYLGVSRYLIQGRLQQGWSEEDALTRPKQIHNRQSSAQS